jgi:hypothetical protein
MTPHLYTLDAHGQPQPTEDVLAWGQWMETAERRVCRDYDEGDGTKRVYVSTDSSGRHNHFGDGPPVPKNDGFLAALLDRLGAPSLLRGDRRASGHAGGCKRPRRGGARRRVVRRG